MMEYEVKLSEQKFRELIVIPFVSGLKTIDELRIEYEYIKYVYKNTFIFDDINKYTSFIMTYM